MEYDELACTQCSSQFDEYDHTPHMIPHCGHTFCLKCIQTMMEQTSPGGDFTCPEDRIVMTLPDKDLSNFPKNYILIRLVEKRKLLKGFDHKSTPVPSAKRCTTKEDDSASTMDELLSLKKQLSVQTKCSEYTNKNNSSTESVSNKEDDASPTSDNGNVCQHHKKNFEVVCLDHKCRICTNCALFGAHKNHEIRPEGDVMKEVTARAEKIVDLLQTIELDEKAIFEQKDIEKFSIKVREKYNEVSQSIRQKFNDYINQIRIKERKILEDMNFKFLAFEEKFKEVKQIPSDLDTKVKNWKLNAQTLLTSSKEISQKGQIAFDLLKERSSAKNDVVGVGERLLNDLKAITQLSSKPFENQLDKITVVFSEDFEKTLDKICRLTVPSFDYDAPVTTPFDPIVISPPNHHSDSYQRNTITSCTTIENLRNMIEWDSEKKGQHQDNGLSIFCSLLDASPMKSLAVTHRTSSAMSRAALSKIPETSFLIDADKENRPANNNISPISIRRKTEATPIIHLANEKQMALKTLSKNEPKKERPRQRLAETALPTQRNTPAASISPIRGADPLSRKNSTIKLSNQFEPILEGIKRKTLRTADLTGAGIGDHGVHSLAEFLKVNHNLKSLKLVKNKITDEGGLALVNALYCNTGLNTVYLSQNLLTEKTIDALIDLCKLRKTLKTIYFSQNSANMKNSKLKVKEFAKLGVTLHV